MLSTVHLTIRLPDQDIVRFSPSELSRHVASDGGPCLHDPYIELVGRAMLCSIYIPTVDYDD